MVTSPVLSAPVQRALPGAAATGGADQAQMGWFPCPSEGAAQADWGFFPCPSEGAAQSNGLGYGGWPSEG